MKKLLVASAVMLLALSISTRSAEAVIVVPTFDTFGSLPAATFGGTGIPNNAVAITTVTDGSNTITLGLTAHQRFSAPAVTNDGAGTFTAQAGVSAGASLWNFAYYMNIAGGGSFADYQFKLLYDFDKGTGTDDTDHGVFDFNNALTAFSVDPSTVIKIEDSQNLTFGFLSTSSSWITPPPSATYNPNDLGEYTFQLQVSDTNGVLGTSAILVNAVPEPSAFLFGGLVCSVLGANYVRKRLKSGQPPVDC